MKHINLLMRCINLAGLRTPRRTQYSARSWKPIITKLTKLKLLEEQNSQLSCTPLIVEVLTRRAVAEGTFEGFATAVAKMFPSYQGWYYGSSEERMLRDARLVLYRQDADAFFQLLESISHQYPEGFDTLLWEKIFSNPFDDEWMVELPTAILEPMLYAATHAAHRNLRPATKLIELIGQLDTTDPAYNRLYFVHVQHLILCGRFEEASQLVPNDTDDINHLALRAWLYVLKGGDAHALPLYEAGLKVMRKEMHRRKVYYQSLAGIYYILALLRSGNSEHLQRADTYVDVALGEAGHPFLSSHAALNLAVKQQQGQLFGAPVLPEDIFDTSVIDLELYFAILTHYWLDRKSAGGWISPLQSLLQQAEDAGYLLVAAEVAELLYRLNGKEEYQKQAAQWRQQIGLVSIVDAVVLQEPWEIALKALAQMPQDKTSHSARSESESRLIWLLHYTESQYGSATSLSPREQKRKKNGGWTKGRAVALKRLFEQRQSMDFLSEQDERVCQTIGAYRESGYRYYSAQVVFAFDEGKALLALTGHPLVFLQSEPTVPVELVESEPTLQVTRQGGELLIELNPPIDQDQGVDDEIVVVRESPTRFKLVPISAAHQRVAQILGPQGLRIPEEARPRVLETLTALSPLLTVHSDIGGGQGAEAVEAEARLVLHLMSYGEGLRAEALVRPFGKDGPYFQPGTGGETVFAQIEERRLQTQRDLQEERRHSAALLQACPVLQRVEEAEGQWLIPQPEDGLQLLLELGEMGEEVVVEWPQGEEWQVRHRASWQDLSLRLSQDNDWLGLEGELRLDEGQVLNMRQLLALLDSTPGRFLPLGERRFLALTDEFRKRLEDLRGFGEDQGEGLRFHPLLAPLVDELAQDAGQVTTDAAWKKQLARLREAQTIEPEVPSTLQAELRDYQSEGFSWAWRLAHWGVGACLADDMGLGKTVQALALMLARAPEGPALVVAPTSVCANWIDEAHRFAPTLRAITFGPGDRKKVLAQAGPFDLVVCSYGLLQHERERFKEVAWHTIVLDEAQAIKNMSTRRSQAAMSLQGKFKMITTGTPIENHLGELWNLFRFINPGLLGSLQRFNKRFATPIEKDRDPEARRRLKRLIQPFMLRRRKSQVLAELPSRTEITLQVELSPEETAFYEALRRRAMESLDASQAQAGQKHLQILAEIMRLRRACCHPQLVLPEAPATCAKMEVFGQVLDELQDNNHKALVFSQFVDYLQIVRHYLDDRGMHYQYLDGSTPARQRKKRVDAFQAGEGEVFLISLRAGGQGLNLTAADYVIHLDPWWNPAVEDQASDRAHRIGQERPVTIYRLVTRNTIEEKIVALHQRKRDLADGLLEGGDLSGKISATELLQLMREG